MGIEIPDINGQAQRLILNTPANPQVSEILPAKYEAALPRLRRQRPEVDHEAMIVGRDCGPLHRKPRNRRQPDMVALRQFLERRTLGTTAAGLDGTCLCLARWPPEFRRCGVQTSIT